MRELQKKQILKRRMYSIPALILLLVLVLLTVRGTWQVLEKRAESIKYVEALEERSKILEERKRELDEEVDYLETEAGIDEEIKERFNVAKMGEKVVIIVDPKPIATTTLSEDVPWYKRFWNAIIPGQ
ncbi:MAG: septum formation initiator family protein [bacterium]|nr:septum formation initiator family protein [bacterium]